MTIQLGPMRAFSSLAAVALEEAAAAAATTVALAAAAVLAGICTIRLLH